LHFFIPLVICPVRQNRFPPLIGRRQLARTSKAESGKSNARPEKSVGIIEHSSNKPFRSLFAWLVYGFFHLQLILFLLFPAVVPSHMSSQSLRSSGHAQML